MNQKKVLNIVKLAVNDRVGKQSHIRNQGIVFYEDGTVNIVEYDDAVQLAKQQNIRIQQLPGDVVSKDYQQFRTIANYRPYGKKKESTATKPEASSKKATKKKTEKVPTYDYFEELDDEEEKTGNLFTRAMKKIGRVITFPFRKFYQGVSWACDLYTRKVLQRDKAEARRRKLERKAKAKEARKNAFTKFKELFTVKRNKKGKKVGFFKKFRSAAAAIGTAIALTIGVGAAATGCANNNATTAANQVADATLDNLSDLTDDELLQMIQNNSLTAEQILELIASGQMTNDDFLNFDYQLLLDITTNETQKQEMQKIGNFLDSYNGTFADYYLEENHAGVRAALRWEEVSALSLAYNDFSKEEIAAIFNGYEVKSAEFTEAYKEATLQLFGAFAMSDRDHSIPIEMLVNDSEGQAFVQKYKDLFYDVVEATGQAKIDAANRLYQEVFKDYPIDSEIREVGISHAESRNSMESYKLAAVPIISAAEAMFQNLEIDHTLYDKAVEYFNDIGLCNYAQGQFDRAETITLSSQEDEKNPTYQQFMDAKIRELTAEDIYYKNDLSRDLSQLDKFQDRVNWHFNLDANGNLVVGDTLKESYTVRTYTESTTQVTGSETKTSNVSREEAVSRFGEDEVRRREAAVNRQFDAENEEAKRQADAAAEEKRQELQQEADKAAEEVRQEIEDDEKDLQQDIEDANNQIDENNKDQNPGNDTPIKEEDFGDHGVDFDGDPTTDNGELDDSVQDITTNGDGVGGEMPDPGESGDAFDQEAPDYNNQPSGTVGGDSSYGTYEEPIVTNMPSGDSILEYEEGLSNEAIADAMVEEMANAGNGEYTYGSEYVR